MAKCYQICYKISSMPGPGIGARCRAPRIARPQERLRDGGGPMETFITYCPSRPKRREKLCDSGEISLKTIK
jgi:hypothetical protein